jgi:hypothetical protein
MQEKTFAKWQVLNGLQRRVKVVWAPGRTNIFIS